MHNEESFSSRVCSLISSFLLHVKVLCIIYIHIMIAEEAKNDSELMKKLEEEKAKRRELRETRRQALRKRREEEQESQRKEQQITVVRYSFLQRLFKKEYVHIYTLMHFRIKMKMKLRKNYKKNKKTWKPSLP